MLIKRKFCKKFLWRYRNQKSKPFQKDNQRKKKPKRKKKSKRKKRIKQTICSKYCSIRRKFQLSKDFQKIDYIVLYKGF